MYTIKYYRTRFFRRETPSLGGRLLLFDPIYLLNIHLPPRSGNLPLFELHFLPIIFSLKRVNCIEFWNENALRSQQSVTRREYLIIFKISAQIWMLIDKINVTEWFLAKSPSFARCKEGDLPLLNFSKLTCMFVAFNMIMICCLLNSPENCSCLWLMSKMNIYS